MQLIFASNNQNKLLEIKKLINPEIQLITLKEAGISEELPEPFDTFRENAWSKANYVYRKTNLPCFAEDSGIIARALGKEPGVFSARYSGGGATDASNNDLLLENMRGQADRFAWYQCTICLMTNAEESQYFEGRCEGTLLEQAEGEGGFGYDPLFVPEGYDNSFGILPMSVKNTISHRAKATQLLVNWLNVHFQ